MPGYQGPDPRPLQCGVHPQNRPPATHLQEEGGARRRVAQDPPHPSASHIPVSPDRLAEAAVVRSSARLPPAQAERTPEASQTAGSLLGGPHVPSAPAARPPPRPAAPMRFPSPARRGFRRAGPGASGGCEEGARQALRDQPGAAPLTTRLPAAWGPGDPRPESDAHDRSQSACSWSG